MKPLNNTNAKKFEKVAVLMGGGSAERDISIKSGTAVYEALKRQGVDVFAIDVEDKIIEQLSEIKIDRVFNMIHGRGGEDGLLQGILETMKIPYTGSSVMASALTMDKLRTKLCWQGHGLKTPKWFVFENEKDIDPCIKLLSFPVIVKPSQEGSSIGMSKANNKAELRKALSLALQFNCQVYAEQWVSGEEYTVAILADEALPVIRLETARGFYDYEAKYQANNTKYHCPCGLSPQQETEMQLLALEACNVVGVNGWGRVDLFIDESGVSQLIEVNTVPGMTDHSLVPMAAKANGIDFDQLVWRILETSLA
ncbi:MAG: D-alanine--D-alanine ligase [Methylococcales symbiont of Hymedesmia sp. n. MRB-2018]|nr:MAG: D-alanine--D-alanine ligase [Methylococcales symbiont of Hymedesmia sp. n. MRB-2018]KAF3983713.1 MAG: D-alanine--D-alanine ligase [Methylococcales symbiont of Hymedesmia sp. n. MRB-2018]